MAASEVSHLCVVERRISEGRIGLFKSRAVLVQFLTLFAQLSNNHAVRNGSFDRFQIIEPAKERINFLYSETNDVIAIQLIGLKSYRISVRPRYICAQANCFATL